LPVEAWGRGVEARTPRGLGKLAPAPLPLLMPEIRSEPATERRLEASWSERGVDPAPRVAAPEAGAVTARGATWWGAASAGARTWGEGRPPAPKTLYEGGPPYPLVPPLTPLAAPRVVVALPAAAKGEGGTDERGSP